MSRYRVLNPATGVIENEFPEVEDHEISDVCAHAHAAYLRWRATSKAERSLLLSAVADLYLERADKLAATITREMGKTVAEARGEVEFSASIYRYYAENGEMLLADEPLNSESVTGKAVIRKAPIGALLGIMPWNYPFYQVARFAAPNLMVGNTIILKHAQQCPESALEMERIFEDAGFPPHTYTNVFATTDQIATLIADDRICGVSVTGSERAGMAVAAQAGHNLKKVVLELGGSDPFIVLDAEDIAAAASAAVAARMENAGQSCNASKRMIVADSHYDEFLGHFVDGMQAQVLGDPTDPRTTCGPLASESAVEFLLAQIDDAVAKGAKLHTGGQRLDRPGFFVEPTVLSGVTPEMRAYHEELFGPVAVLHRVADADAAVTLANDSPYGLGAVVYARDTKVALDIADQLDTGMVWINEPEGGGPDLPFGGTKRSGVGRELGPLGIDEFVNKKLIHHPVG
ncbi:NAD-dependent succinate-semialdehyde dehydrogenase [Rhodococcus sp. NPDC057529]|uniref:NAD-dependent succinate-semialdehyde dehydrogenase n=1 Tax=Rhodococcus sp. NPDC057529 TaxID=3346158 RepID=UPI00366DC8EF